MDTRIVKTKHSIRNAFLKLREKLALEDLKVSELCSIAMINKTTFYKHYAGLYSLSGEIEDELLDAVLEGFGKIDDLFTDPKGFVTGLFSAFKPYEKLVRILFNGGRTDLLLDKIETRFRAHYPEMEGAPEREVMMSFMLRGAAHLLMRPSKYGEGVMLAAVAAVIDRMIGIMGEEMKR